MQLDLNRFFSFGRNVLNRSSAIQFVPRERTALNSALQSPEKNERKNLPIGETLQPDLTEQPRIFAGFRLAALQSEGDG